MRNKYLILIVILFRCLQNWLILNQYAGNFVCVWVLFASYDVTRVWRHFLASEWWRDWIRHLLESPHAILLSCIWPWLIPTFRQLHQQHWLWAVTSSSRHFVVSRERHCPKQLLTALILVTPIIPLHFYWRRIDVFLVIIWWSSVRSLLCCVVV